MRIVAGVFNPIAYDGRVQRAAAALSELGDVVVVCPTGPPLSGPHPFRLVPVPLPGGPFIGRYFAFARAFVAAVREEAPDVIHAHDYYLGPPGAIGARLTGARLLYDAHELNLPEPGGWRRSPLLRLFATLERLTIPRADLVIAANAERAERMAAHYGLPEPPLVVQNIPDHSGERAPGRDGDGGDDGHKGGGSAFVLVYQGVIILRRGLGRILDALARLPAGYRLVIVGGGPDADRLPAEVAARGLEARVELRGRVPRAELEGILRECDAGVLTYGYDSLNDRLCAPNKIFEYARAGLPVLATDQAPLRRMVWGYNLGVLFGETDGPEVIAAHIQELAVPRATFRRGLERFLADHPWDAEADRLRAAVAGLEGGEA
ncbi:MAG TPA: glycosyltransferase [Candidatus Limnocylindrales bacterium]|nr:glycosyltransferase [Candidatus Limnocylindrales bacterium]